MTRDEWLDRFAAVAGVEAPDNEEAEALLELAGAAARASERTAAPLTCWLAAKAGIAPADALVMARQLAAAPGDTPSERG